MSSLAKTVNTMAPTLRQSTNNHTQGAQETNIFPACLGDLVGPVFGGSFLGPLLAISYSGMVPKSCFLADDPSLLKAIFEKHMKLPVRWSF